MTAATVPIIPLFIYFLLDRVKFGFGLINGDDF